MVLEVSAKPQRYIALEGNRRVTALRLLMNPAAMTGLDMPNGMQRSIERLASIFDKSKVEPIDAYEVGAREDRRYWIELRHNGEDQGRGVVGWKPIVAARFRKMSRLFRPSKWLWSMAALVRMRLKLSAPDSR
jgi:hypothetical protein